MPFAARIVFLTRDVRDMWDERDWSSGEGLVDSQAARFLFSSRGVKDEKGSEVFIVLAGQRYGLL